LEGTRHEQASWLKFRGRAAQAQRSALNPQIMKRLTLMVALLTVTIISISLAQQPTIYGTYQDCPFHCRTIKINRDHTFEYRLDGDLYNDERHKGTWKFIDRNKIRATTPPDRSPLQVTEKPGKGADYFSVLVIDHNSIALQGVFVSGDANGTRFSVTTNDIGTARIPKSRQFELSCRDYRGNHRVLDSSAREFVVMLTVEQLTNWEINDTWLIEGNRLYIVAEDGSFDRGYWLDKLSNKASRKVFR